jgi:hypothetical protein
MLGVTNPRLAGHEDIGLDAIVRLGGRIIHDGVIISISDSSLKDSNAPALGEWQGDSSS